ncbi:TonB family protein [Paracoccus stylophorae]|uniref:TonB family protein n=1 Tax=Paracoccus stylophorae TaxID=659350 RepID=A0ABY7SW19_9RHOB|nr:TonB family protein [Paracoccus stylophorae]WCR10673.1 TonB family protein [Paracoccus stylophorae]
MARRVAEIAGFLVIATALHMTAAATILPDRPAAGPARDAPAAALTAGSGQMADLVAQWEQPPQAATTTADPAPQTEAQVDADPAISPPRADRARVLAAMPAPRPAAPDASPARPNLPEPPQDRPAPIPPDLPDLRSFAPPQIRVASPLRLQASARPERRPARSRPQPEPQPQPQPRRAEPAADRQPQRQAAQPSAPSRGGGASGVATQRSSGGNGGGSGISAGQRASLMARWQGQLSSCLLRSIARTSGAAGARGSVAFTISRNGRVQGARVTGSTGNARVDREISRAVQRARCPAAPAGLTDASYTFAQPFNIR